MSPVADAKVLRTAAKERVFAPAYYFYGDDDYLKNEELRRLIDAAIDPGTRDFNLEFLRGAEVDATTLGSIAGTPPMMAERRAVVVREVNALRKDARAVLDTYLERPAPDALIVVVTGAGVKHAKALLSSTTTIQFAQSGARSTVDSTTSSTTSGSVDHERRGEAATGSGRHRTGATAGGADACRVHRRQNHRRSGRGGRWFGRAETLGDFRCRSPEDAVAALGCWTR